MPIDQITTASLDSALNAPTATALSTASGSAPSYSARAWVNFKGTDTVTIRASGNVSSITDNGTGQYTVNFTTAIIDNAYCTQYSCTSNDDTGFTTGGGRQFAMIRLGTTTSVQVQCIDDGGGLADSITNHVAVFC